MVYEDDRTEEQKSTHNVLIAGTDSFLSGWGEAENGTSVAAWACTPDDAPTVEQWVRSRSDMKRVRIVGNDWKPKAAHVHIYVVHDKHPARFAN